ncbi:MAG: EsaB/YukD family protein [Arachnia propionica]|uniref:EsaB/YukD family protein n=1 Tax=Arachnia propionica TaxID=1750 RepID=UPI0026FCF703|nr:EsaB/YukD family protein [Arachnia propionica]
MSSTRSTDLPQLLPITVTAHGEQVDLSVPPDIAVAELLPGMVRAVSSLDPTSATRGFTLRTASGRVLSQARSLPEQGVRAGALLMLDVTGESPDDQRYDDLVEAVGLAVADRSTPWSGQDSVQLSAHCAACLVLLAAVLLATGSRDVTLTATIGIAGAGLTTLATAVIARIPNRSGALALGHTVPVLLGCSAFAWASGPWFALPLMAAGAGLALGATALLTLPAELKASLAAPLTTGLSLLLAGGLIQLGHTPPESAGALVVALLVVISLSAPWVAIARLPVSLGTRDDRSRIDGATVGRAVALARTLVISLKAGSSVGLLIMAPLLSTSAGGIALLATAGVALMLATRALRSSVEVLIGVLTGMVLTLVAAIATNLVLPAALPWLLGALLVTAGLVLAVNVVSPAHRPAWARVVDAVGVVALLALLPLAALVWGIL